MFARTSFTRLLAPLLIVAAPVYALLIEPLSIETLTDRAEIVLQGTVLSKSCQRDASGRIYTKLELQVADVWKGAVSGSPYVIVHGGGTLGEEQATVSGQVEYAVGEEVVAFLVRNSRGEGVTLGLLQGKFRVWQDSTSSTKYVTSPFHGQGSDNSSIALQRRTGSTEASAPLTLAELKQRVVEARR